MNEVAKAAYIISQAVCAMAEIEAMKVANTERESNGYALAYDEESFLRVIKKYNIGHDFVVSFLHG